MNKNIEPISSARTGIALSAAKAIIRAQQRHARSAHLDDREYLGVVAATVDGLTEYLEEETDADDDNVRGRSEELTAFARERFVDFCIELALEEGPIDEDTERAEARAYFDQLLAEVRGTDEDEWNRPVETRVGEAEYELLQSILVYDTETQRLVDGAVHTERGYVLSGTAMEFDELLGFIAGAANHESDGVRQERLDVLYDEIAERTGV